PAPGRGAEPGAGPGAGRLAGPERERPGRGACGGLPAHRGRVPPARHPDARPGRHPAGAGQGFAGERHPAVSGRSGVTTDVAHVNAGIRSVEAGDVLIDAGIVTAGTIIVHRVLRLLRTGFWW